MGLQSGSPVSAFHNPATITTAGQYDLAVELSTNTLTELMVGRTLLTGLACLQTAMLARIACCRTSCIGRDDRRPRAVQRPAIDPLVTKGKAPAPSAKLPRHH